MLMLAGLWGAQMIGSKEVWGEVERDIWTNILADPLSKSDRGKKGPEQTLLGRHVWDNVPGGVMQHDSFLCSQYPDGSNSFPSERPNSTGNLAGASPDRKQENIALQENGDIMSSQYPQGGAIQKRPIDNLNI